MKELKCTLCMTKLHQYYKYYEVMNLIPGFHYFCVDCWTNRKDEMTIFMRVGGRHRVTAIKDNQRSIIEENYIYREYTHNVKGF